MKFMEAVLHGMNVCVLQIQFEVLSPVVSVGPQSAGCTMNCICALVKKTLVLLDILLAL